MKEIRSKLRNVAIIAHVDHGKTTMVDQMLRQTGALKDNAADRVMDSNDIERERGITILAKNTGITYGDYTINLVDTPGHSDFGGEVERTLQMVEGFILLVDAAEGVLPGTRFVLQKALQLNLKPIVLINKIDRKDADIERTENSINELFLEIANDPEHLEFVTLYGSSRIGYVSKSSDAKEGNMLPLLDAIIEQVPTPTQKVPYLQFLTTNLGHNDFLGTIAIGRIFNGSLHIGDQVVCCKDGVVGRPLRLTKIFKFDGLSQVEVQEAMFGDIVALTGFDEPVFIGTTICSPENPQPYPYVKIDEPTLSIFLSVNDSPFNGRDGTALTSRQIKDRLDKELKTNVALRVESTSSPDVFKVSGRGQLHLGIMVENMRREGFEMQLSAPEVIYKTIDGAKHEPIEYLIIDVPSDYQGAVMENLGRRKAQLKNMEVYGSNRVRLEYEVPSRALIGFRSQFLTETRGTGVAGFSFLGYQPYKGEISTRTKGALVSMEAGAVTTYALDNLQTRGILFVKPADQVYEGMIVGENSRDNDMDVNPCKGKKLTNMRASGTDDAAKLAPVHIMELETCLEWIRPDELIEVTPHDIRLRKRHLKATMRKRN
jgi:GTP-binding protein